MAGAHAALSNLILLFIEQLIEQTCRRFRTGAFQIVDLAGGHSFDIGLEFRILGGSAYEEGNPRLRPCA